jgi:hypothetical protein
LISYLPGELTMKAKLSTGRRKFLATVGAGSAAAAAVALSGKAPDSVPAAPSSARQGKGYQVSEHVKKYYDTTKI